MNSTPIVYSVIIPVFNESRNIPILVEQIDVVLKSFGVGYEILMVNDQGTDNSYEVLELLRKQYLSLCPIYRQSSSGAGYALREGFQQAKGTIIITMDGDLSHDPKDIPILIQGLDEADMVCGSRYTKGGRAQLSFIRCLASQTFNWLIRQAIGIPIKDVTSNFRVFRREIIEKIVLQRGQLGVAIEIVIQAYLSGFSITERPINYRLRLHGISHSSFKQWLDYLKAFIDGAIMRWSKKF